MIFRWWQHRFAGIHREGEMASLGALLVLLALAIPVSFEIIVMAAMKALQYKKEV